MAQKQAISFLELNTLGHAICALLIYGLWWDKPLDIDSPSLLEGEEAWEICALMCVISNGEHFWNRWISRLLFRRSFSRKYENRQETELSRGQKYGDRVISKWTEVFNGHHLARLRRHRSELRMILRWDPVPDLTNNSRPRVDNITTVIEHAEKQPEPSLGEVFQIKKGDALFGFRCMDVYTQADWYQARIQRSRQADGLHSIEQTGSERRYQSRLLSIDDRSRNRNDVRNDVPERYCTLESSDLRRWGLVSRAWQKYQTKLEEHDRSARTRKPELYDGVCDRMHNWPTTRYEGNDLSTLYGQDFGMELLNLMIAGGLYGGLHLLAWNAPIASWGEQFVWCASGVLIASSGILYFAFMVVSALEEPLLQENLIAYLFTVPWLCSFVIVSAVIIAYIPARAFLIVECGLQMARLPRSAYELPQWSQYYPHIN